MPSAAAPIECPGSRRLSSSPRFCSRRVSILGQRAGSSCEATGAAQLTMASLRLSPVRSIPNWADRDQLARSSRAPPREPSSRQARCLREKLRDLTAEARLGLLRQLAEALGHAHGKRLYHRGLAPQNVLVHGVAEGQPRLQIMNWQVASRDEGSQPAILVTSGTRNIDEHFGDPAKVYLPPEALSGGATRGQPKVDSL